MIQIVEQTHEEKMKMYMKLTKEQIIEMLIESDKYLPNIKPFKNARKLIITTNTED